MPVQRCVKNGKSGWKWGDEGKCYTGPDAKQKAIDQGLAITGGKIDKYNGFVAAIQGKESE